MKKLMILMFGCMVMFGLSSQLFSHCQVPCGIFDDALRFKLMAEHIVTMEKAMEQITVLNEEKKPNINQLVRWVTNKEKHAEEMSEILSYYFLAQRIKPVGSENKADFNKYQQQLVLIHQLIVYTMKAKQSIDLELIKKLKTLLTEFEKSYFAKS
jgi:nickel superoxide dismutase